MITVLSLGAGVQSSTLALMAAHGEVPMPDCAIFADTKAEPKAVYVWLDWLEKQLPYPVHRVTSGNLLEDQLTAKVGTVREGGRRGASLPYFSDNSGKAGMMPRQCTAEYKIEPVDKYLRREIMGLKFRQRAPKTHTIDLWYGISLDELQRCKREFVEPWKRNVYPLIEQRMTRGHCFEWMTAHGYPEPPRSSCTICPFHSSTEWAKLKASDEWPAIIAFDAAIRGNGRQNIPGNLYLHRDLKPIDEVDFTTAESAGQMSFMDECEGFCGV
jgi:hypothetical protein